jgi:hypothetical protein
MFVLCFFSILQTRLPILLEIEALCIPANNLNTTS